MWFVTREEAEEWIKECRAVNPNAYKDAEIRKHINMPGYYIYCPCHYEV